MIASRYGTVLLKGRRTLIDDGSITKAVEEGNQALAVPGSGDVLSGAIAAFSASGLSLFDSACLGACVHGRAGKMVFENYGVDGGLASAVADAIPMVLKTIFPALPWTQDPRHALSKRESPEAENAAIAPESTSPEPGTARA